MTRPWDTAVTRPSSLTVATRLLLEVQSVPSLRVVTSRVELSGKVAVAVNCVVSPSTDKKLTGPVAAIDTGKGSSSPKVISPIAIRLGAVEGSKKSDCP